MIVYEIPGVPIPWKRARRNGKRYFDAQEKDKEFVYWEIKNAMNGLFSHVEPIKVTMEYQMPIPKSWSKKRQREAVGKPHHSTPDVDNLAKFIHDACNGLLWKDDAIIYELCARKVYSEEPKTRIWIERYDGQELHHLLPRS